MAASLRWLALASLIGATVSCRGCSDDRNVAVLKDATTEDARREASGDLESFRARARVPAIGWAWVTRKLESSGAVGLADVEHDEAASATTAFEAASIAKTVIATCVMQLVEQHELSLDADVSSYVGFPVRHPRLPAPITVRQLLTHTASIVDREETRASSGPPLADFLRTYFADAGNLGVFLDAGPGTAMAYSNVGPSLAALAVERVSGERFADRARRRVFEPLGMRATAFGHDALPIGVRVATPYATRGSGYVRLSPASHALYPVVDLFASPKDLARFARAVLRGGELDGARILSSESVAEMFRVQLPDAAPEDGLGWQVRSFGGRRVVGHEGEDLGASTGLYLDTTSSTGALVLANGDAFQSDTPERARALSDLIETLFASARTTTP